MNIDTGSIATATAAMLAESTSTMATGRTTAKASAAELRLYLVSALAISYVAAWWSLTPAGVAAPDAGGPTSPSIATAQRPARAAAQVSRLRRVTAPARRIRTRSS